MSYPKALLAARQHLVVILGLLSAAALVSWLEMPSCPVPPPLPAGEIPGALHGALSEEETRWAQAAWRYFQRNSQEETGLVDAADGRSVTTLWDTGSHLLAMIAAHRLGVIDRSEFDQRLGRVLNALARIPLFQGELPNRFYLTETLGMADAEGLPSDRGVGWSAVDIARVLVPLDVIVWNYPAHAAEASAVVRRWRLDRLVREGVLTGAVVDAQGQVEYSQEGRGAYEAYAAKALALMGIAAPAVAVSHGYAKVQGVEVPFDPRPPERFSTRNYTVGEPYVIEGLEFGWDRGGREEAWRVFRAQENRFKATGRLTAASSGPVDEAPYFVYNAVYAGTRSWQTLTTDGREVSDFRFLNAGDAVGWHVLYDTEYGRQLAEKAAGLFDPERGWYAGWYETKDRVNRAMSAGTNAMVLEAMHFRQFGALVAVQPPLELAEPAPSTRSQAAQPPPDGRGAAARAKPAAKSGPVLRARTGMAGSRKGKGASAAPKTSTGHGAKTRKTDARTERKHR
ncbi:DUF3131 domain-containing protein [Methylococcus capsulatus]|uniref:DUF3131 domain-containing protein n=1 Tax=Methylococcus capsulatus TaxID=414 RepID=UPI001C52D6CF|nr:DUF3131 domain-containing protein [Methylococcus capsulatus]QXP88493.1 DUF3131 domain-containing protein [Methylococcus capsulatus]QXP94491.1 DUF3131 domain-containing protein [Methylococcus capsulatus]UQN13542.1 DUF3131 domain-containing protein [Methylococcus capsulatus]